jgi:ribosomal silencing factor RsfS
MVRNLNKYRFKTSFLYWFIFLTLNFLFIFLFDSLAATQVSLEWDPNSEPDLAGYRVFCREQDQSFNYSDPCWEGIVNYCTIYNLEETKSYCFVVRALDNEGLESENSNEVCVDVGETDPANASNIKGDFDGNGTTDILWRRGDTGEVAVWLMNGSTRSAYSLGSVTTDWEIVDIANFDGNTTDDILWRHTGTGEVVSWLMNGFTKTVHSYGNVPLVWEIVSVGQFDADNSTDDILWRRGDTGEVAVWLMNGSTRSAYSLGGVTTDWEIVDIANFDGNTTDDILWRHTGTGAVVSWLMNGFTKTVHSYGNVPLVWEMVK